MGYGDRSSLAVEAFLADYRHSLSDSILSRIPVSRIARHKKLNDGKIFLYITSMRGDSVAQPGIFLH